MATKITVVALRIIAILIGIRVGISAIQSGSIFLLIITGGIVYLTYKMPQIVKSW